jgi:hypothetical protein
MNRDISSKGTAMNKSKKIIGWLAAITGLAAAVMLVALLLAPLLIKTAWVRQEIQNYFSRDLAATIEFHRINLRYLPRPHVIIYQASFSLPSEVSGKTASVVIYPKILPLFRQRFELAKLRIEDPQYSIRLPQMPVSKSNNPPALSFAAIFQKVNAALTSLTPFNLPGVSVQLKNGSLDLLEGNRRLFGFQDIEAHYKRPAERTEFSLSCKSSLWQEILINGWFDASGFKSSGHIQLTRFQPQALSSYLFPDSEFKITDALANLSIDFETNGTERFEANIDGAVPYLKLSQANQSLIIKGQHIKGALQIDKNQATVSLEELSSNFPRLQLSGKFFMDPSQPRVTLDLEGRKLDVESIRKAALTLSGPGGITAKIFNIIQGGEIPAITFHSQGRTLADLKNAQDIVIQGNMLAGRIVVPEARMDLDHVEGQAVISKEVLVGENIKARYGNSLGEKGKLEIGLSRGVTPLHLSVMVQADLSQLPPVLERLVKNKDFQTELSSIKELEGTATGKLVLGGSTKNVNVQVEVSAMHLKTRYQRIPYPLIMDGGRLFFDEDHVELNNFNAVCGKSFLSQLSSTLSWGKAIRLNLLSQKALISLDQIYPWLLTFGDLKPALDIFKPLKGTLALQELEYKGPLSIQDTPQLELRAKFDESNLTSKRLPGPIVITAGQFSWQGPQIRLQNLNGRLGKSDFSQLSTELEWGRAAHFEVKSESALISLDEIYPWLLSFAKLENSLQVISAVTGTLGLRDVEIKGPPDRPAEWRFAAQGELQNLVLTSDILKAPVSMADGKFIVTQADYSGVALNCLKVGSSHLTWGESHLMIVGDIFFPTGGPILDMDVSLDRLDWDRIEKIIAYAKEKEGASNHRLWKRQIRGNLKINAEYFQYKGYVLQPVQADLSFKPDELAVAIEKADLCGIALDGVINVADQNLEYYFVPKAKNQDLAHSLACLSNQKAEASGKYSLDGEIMAKIKPQTTSEFYSGNLHFSADNGRIYRFGLLAKILAILNVTEIFRGEVPDLLGKGFAYKTITARVNFHGSKLLIKEFSIDGNSMTIVSEGEINLVEEKLNLVVLVAPFKTVDTIIKKIPLVRTILGGKLISIPFRAVGDLNDYQVIPLSPTAVGSGILGIMERTAKLPFTIIQPLLEPEKKEKPQAMRPEN